MNLKPITSRLPHLFIAPPISVCIGAVGTLAGSVGALISVATLARRPNICNKTTTAFIATQISLPMIYESAIQTINPSAKLPKIEHLSTRGLIAGGVLETIDYLGNDCIESKNPLVRHVGSRAVYALYAVAAVVTRVFDLTIGLVAAVFSIALLGTNEKLNDCASKGLEGLGLVGDLFYSTMKMLNPSLKIQSLEGCANKLDAYFKGMAAATIAKAKLQASHLPTNSSPA